MTFNIDADAVTLMLVAVAVCGIISAAFALAPAVFYDDGTRWGGMNSAMNGTIIGAIALALGIYVLADPDLASLDVMANMAKALIAVGVITIVIGTVKFVRADRSRWM